MCLISEEQYQQNKLISLVCFMDLGMKDYLSLGNTVRTLSSGNWKLLENIFYLRCQQHFYGGHEPIFKCPEVGFKSLKLLKIMQDCRAVLERKHKYSLIFCYCWTGTSSQQSINTAEKLELLAQIARCKHEILFVCYTA